MFPARREYIEGKQQPVGEKFTVKADITSIDDEMKLVKRVRKKVKKKKVKQPVRVDR